MPAAEKTVVGRVGARVCCFQHQVFCFVDERLLFLRKLSPKQKDHVLFQCRDLFDDCMCKFCPTDLCMAHGFAGTHCKRSVEEQHALFGPFGKVAMPWYGSACIAMQ